MYRSWTAVAALALLAAACTDHAGPPDPSALLGSDAANLPPVADPGGPYAGHGEIQLDGRRSTDPDGHFPLRYAWDFGDGTTGTGPTPLHRYPADGVYTVTLTVTDSLGATSLPGVTLATITGYQEPESVGLSGAGNIARCATQRDEATAALLDDLPGLVVALGDNALPDGSLASYENCYHASWGRHKDRTYAVLGNHEYDLGNADGAFDYFGDRAGPRGKGYYSFDAAEWHIVVLNDNAAHVPYTAGSEQDHWLVADLAESDARCTLALWHVPRFLSSNSAGWTDNPSRKTLWNRLYAAGADVVLNGHQHHYERMAPMTPDGTRDDATGIRQFNVGTGGDALSLPTVAIHPHSEALAAAYGVISLTLNRDGYDWEFRSVDGSYRDSGSGSCH